MKRRRAALAVSAGLLVALAGAAQVQAGAPVFNGFPNAGLDQFPSGGMVDITIQPPGQQPVNEMIDLTSQGLQDAQVVRGAYDPATMSFPTEIVSMQLRGNSPTLGQFFVSVGRNYGLPPSQGQVNNIIANGGFHRGDSFFDVFFRIDAPESRFGPIQVQNEQPIRVQSRIYDLPPNLPEPIPNEARLNDHYKCYTVARLRGTPAAIIGVADQYEAIRQGRLRPVLLCNPASKNGSSFASPRAHLTCYLLARRSGFETQPAGLTNQFGKRTVDVIARQLLCVPSLKAVLSGESRSIPRPTRLIPDPFNCYTVRHREPFPQQGVRLIDQFETQTTSTGPLLNLCNPAAVQVRTTPNEVRNIAGHLSCFALPRTSPGLRVAAVKNTFGVELLAVLRRYSLCLPTHKTPCSEYAERTRQEMQSGGVRVGTINEAIHIPFIDDPLSDCPNKAR